MQQTSAQTLRPPSGLLMMMEARALSELGAFFMSIPMLATAPCGDGHPVLVLPGLLSHDRDTKPLRTFLKSKGYAVSGWEQGRNFGLRDGVEQGLVDQLRRLADIHGRKVSLVGWSLGGLYARQLAKMLPDMVRSVITLGSPFAGHPKASNVWQIYEVVSGQSVDAAQREPMGGPLHITPSAPTTAIFSRTDGICNWRGTREQSSSMAESIEVDGSHSGLGHNPAAVYAIADRLAQAEGEWEPFDRKGWRTLVYRDPHRL